MTNTIVAAVEMMWENGGYSWDPKTETPERGRQDSAVMRVIAQRWADDDGYTFGWSDDWEIGNHRDYYGADSAYADHEPETCESCVMLDSDGDIVGSLGCIDDATDGYRRVIEADLALEVMPVSSVRAWADGFGVWHAAVDQVGTGGDAAATLAARVAITFEIATRHQDDILTGLRFDHRDSRDGILTSYFLESDSDDSSDHGAS